VLSPLKYCVSLIAGVPPKPVADKTDVVVIAPTVAFCVIVIKVLSLGVILVTPPDEANHLVCVPVP
jgi:hypothetical protein